MAKTEKFLRLLWRKEQSFELRRTDPKNWECEEEVEEHEGRGRRPLKQAGERGIVGLLWEPVKLKLHIEEEADPAVNLTDSAAIFGAFFLCVFWWEKRKTLSGLWSECESGGGVCLGITRNYKREWCFWVRVLCWLRFSVSVILDLKIYFAFLSTKNIAI